ncbi:hypothetical protein EC396_01295 [Lutibacter sp. HS1-25]|uniref:hypothetical protein n=1 Tax=Lutibacter sp. HS1-25 TaxID=2485000 RepID=UPI0010127E2F|nr:hypothetical protein [Lutibacter sp. HS1-25]RXP64634.1 hypothetical protein EC396_01295 [Lutibacter sp. HS1-25]
MKKLIFAFTILACTLSQAQNEVKIDLFDGLILKSIEVSYEHFLNEESSLGISAFFNLDEGASFSYNEKTMFTPYFRHHFQSRTNWRFFGEVFIGVNSGEKEIKIKDAPNTFKNYTDGALGIAVGTKYVSPKGFVIDIFGGIGRNLFNSNAPSIVPRAGINIGYRIN